MFRFTHSLRGMQRFGAVAFASGEPWGSRQENVDFRAKTWEKVRLQGADPGPESRFLRDGSRRTWSEGRPFGGDCEDIYTRKRENFAPEAQSWVWRMKLGRKQQERAPAPPLPSESTFVLTLRNGGSGSFLETQTTQEAGCFQGAILLRANCKQIDSCSDQGVVRVMLDKGKSVPQTLILSTQMSFCLRQAKYVGKRGAPPGSALADRLWGRYSEKYSIGFGKLQSRGSF